LTPNPTSSRTRRFRRLGATSVMSRQLTVVLVPVLVAAAISLPSLQARADAARRAESLSGAVARVSHIVALRAALFQERIYNDWAAQIRALGATDLGEVTAYAGYSIEERQRHWSAEANRALADLGEDAGLVTADELASVRARTSENRVTETPLPYVSLEERLDAARTRIFQDVQGDLDVPGGNRVGADLDAVRLNLDVVPGLVDQIDATTVLFMGTTDDGPVVRRVVAAQATQQRVFAELAQSRDGRVVTRAHELDQHPAAGRHRAGMEGLIQGDIPRFGNPADWSRAADLNAAGMEYAALTFEQVQANAAAAAEEAATLAAEAGQDQLAWTIAVSAAALVGVVVSVLVARSVTRPLRRLREHADALRNGDLDVEPLPTGGPTEIDVTSQAVNDLVDNLRLLEAKTVALAECDFDAEVLAQPLPGRLGQSLQRSVRTLSGSMSERDDLQRRILRQATHDELTDLPNRTAATEELRQALARSQRTGHGVAVLLVDLDQFKRVNDTHGQTIGDRVLIEVGDAVRRAEGVSLAARVGGDEFLLLIEDIDGPDPATQLARRLTASLGRTRRFDGVSVTLTASVGVAFSWDGSEDADQVLAGADLAVVRAKQRAAGSVEIYDRRLQEQLVEQAAVEDGLSAALQTDDELFLQYQPVIDFPTGRMSSVEALVRWRHEGGIRPPDSFIPVAERSDLIIELDRWVLARAARQMAEWGDRPELADVHVAVNVSGRHVTSKALHRHVTDLLSATGLDPRRLIIELTETVLVDDLIEAAAQLEAIRRLGVRIALDDFGTGYTSINHLRQLPVDIIKIDRSFVQRLASEREQALLRMITELGHHLGMTITAEGVETAEQYEQLRRLGCDKAQGYHMSRPLPAEALVEWVAGQCPAETSVP
jgi:diguanylate cyclase (GGDEF)-like protein